ncbi:MAG TPA: hypothetical protein VLP43_02985 [Solirubrobacteraceae bacterium]|nr:hypothetical protein [Solirubrobacteraceae bacterium]
MAERRARGDEFASRVNRAAELLAAGSAPAAARGAIEQEFSLSARQALRYVRAAQTSPAGVAVPEATATFTVRLPVGVIAAARAGAAWRGQGIGALTAAALSSHLADADRAQGGAAD